MRSMINNKSKFKIYQENLRYKIQILIESKGKGKSGGAIAITYVYVERETVYLLTI